MLAKPNRITSADDYKGVVRKGRRYVTPHLVTYVRSGSEVHSSVFQGARFGFIVAKTVGGAVQRNLVRRRLKAASALMLDQLPPGTDVVFRALPGSSDVAWDLLRGELVESLERSAKASTARRNTTRS